jgi:hypothetical protein
LIGKWYRITPIVRGTFDFFTKNMYQCRHLW